MDSNSNYPNQSGYQQSKASGMDSQQVAVAPGNGQTGEGPESFDDKYEPASQDMHMHTCYHC